MNEQTFFGLLFFGWIAVTAILYFICDYSERRVKRRRWLKREHKKQRRRKRNYAVIQQAQMDEVAKEYGYGKEL